MTQVGTNQSTTYHSQPSLSTSGGQTGRSSSTSRQQQPSQYDNEQLANIRPRLCILRKWPHYDGYGVHLARNQHWLGLRIGDVEPNSPAESGGLLREDVVLAVNGRSVENDDFFVILSFIQHELEADQIRFLVLDPHSADLVRRNHLNIDENYRTCVQMETPPLTVSPEKILYDQWRSTNNMDPTAAQNTINLGPTLHQNQPNTNAQRHQHAPPPPREGRDNVYTFLPYSDHAIENGKSFFDVLFDQEGDSSSPQDRPHHTIQYPSKLFTHGDDNDEQDVDNTKTRGSQIKDGVKNLAKTGFENIKSIIPGRHHDHKEKPDNIDSKPKTNDETIDNPDESPSLLDKFKSKIKRSSSPTNVTDNTNEEKQSEPNLLRSGETSRDKEDTNNNLRPEPRMCSLSLRPGLDTIGISLQTDKDFGHIIKQVEPNSLADRAGIEQDDCIVSLNEKQLLNIPYEEVLSTLKKHRNERNLDFLVAKKSYLLKSPEYNNAGLGNTQHNKSGKYPDDRSKSAGEVMPSANITDRNNASNIPPSQALEQLYNKYNNGQTNSNQPRETVSTTTEERYDRLSPQLDNDRYPSKQQQQQQQQGQIVQGVGPATAADRSSWGASSGKSTNDLPAPISGDSSIRSTARTQQPDTDDIHRRGGSAEDVFKPLQVGITNPTPAQQSGNVSPNITSSSDQRDHSPKAVSSPNATATSARGDVTSSLPSRQNQSAQQTTPVTTGQTSPTKRDYDQGSSQTTPSTQSDVRLGPTKPMSVPSKPVQASVSSSIYDDTDDDDLSDISEKSSEEDASEPAASKNLQSTGNTPADLKRGRAYPEPLKTPTDSINTADTTARDSKEKDNLNEKRTLTSKTSDADKQPTASSTVTPRSVVSARRVEQSDSEDTTSGGDSLPAKRSVADSFYSPDESVDDGNSTDDQHSAASPPLARKEINLAKSSDAKHDESNASPQLGQKEINQAKPSDKKQDESSALPLLGQKEINQAKSSDAKQDESQASSQFGRTGSNQAKPLDGKQDESEASSQFGRIGSNQAKPFDAKQDESEASSQFGRTGSNQAKPSDHKQDESEASSQLGRKEINEAKPSYAKHDESNASPQLGRTEINQAKPLDAKQDESEASSQFGRTGSNQAKPSDHKQDESEASSQLGQKEINQAKTSDKKHDESNASSQLGQKEINQAKPSDKKQDESSALPLLGQKEINQAKPSDKKEDESNASPQLGRKQDQSKASPQLGRKQDQSSASPQLGKKQDQSKASPQLGKKQDQSKASPQLGKKQDQSKSSAQQKKDNKTADNGAEGSSQTSTTESEKTPAQLDKMALATLPFSDLRDHGYELHNIQLMQPTETSPVGLKLTKQQDPLQFIITAVAKGTKADLAGLKVNDWLVKIEDEDVRLAEFSEVSQDIRQLLTNAGLINMVIARKKTPASSPTTTKIDKQQTSSSPPASISRQQRGQAPGLLTTDITRDTPDTNQVRFTREQSGSPSAAHSQTSPTSSREKTVNAPAGPLSVGITNKMSGDSLTKAPRSESRSTSRSPTRENATDQQQKLPSHEPILEDVDQNDIRQIVLKEALGLDFNSFIPEGDSQIQTHFISNVQPSSMADKAGLRDGDRILTVNGVDVTNSIHEDVRRMMQSKKPLQLTVFNDPKYLELIENVKRNQFKTEDATNHGRTPMKSPSADSGGRSPKSESPKPAQEDLSKHLSVLFTDDQGPVQAKHCLLKKDPTYSGYGLLLRYQNGLHLIDQVEDESPAYNAGLREDDVILYVDKKNVEQMTHDDVKILIRKLSLSNTPIDLVLLKKNDIQRYKNYQEKNTIDWKPIISAEPNKETIQIEQQTVSVTRSSNDQTSVSPNSTSGSSGKQQAPAPPTSSTASTRVCTLQPSAEHTAGFALSGATNPPYVICQIEKNSPAEKAGLLINDALLSINGKSVTEASYKETVALIKEALRQSDVELVVREAPPAQDRDQTKMGSQSSISDQTKGSMASGISSNVDTNDSFGGGEPGRPSNAVEEYQKQRNKELSYTLRLCHLHPTNGDGTQAATFGFELSEDADYEYPIILRVAPQSPAEGAGLQSRDILLKINERKTKGLGYEKVKKEIDKAKRDGRLEMLVVDQETFDYCKRAKKPLKEPEMKVKHIFPKSRSSASFHKLPVVATTTASRDNVEQFSNSMTGHDDNHPSHPRASAGYHLPTSRETDSENEEDIVEQKPLQPVVNFNLSPPTRAHANATAPPHESPLKFFDPARTAPQQIGASSTKGENESNISQSTPSIPQTSTKESKASKTKVLPTAINNLFHKIGHSKSSKRS